jgi:hypothetical protein|tara:strand:+ start:887 stop:1081 length:195 start_codon:yes stop_codon:yes gene_type:complete
MTRSDFNKYLNELNLNSEQEADYWRLYDKINEPKSPLSYNQRANFLLDELRKMKLKKNPSIKKG